MWGAYAFGQPHNNSCARLAHTRVHGGALYAWARLGAAHDTQTFAVPNKYTHGHGDHGDHVDHHKKGHYRLSLSNIRQRNFFSGGKRASQASFAPRASLGKAKRATEATASSSEARRATTTTTSLIDELRSPGTTGTRRAVAYDDAIDDFLERVDDGHLVPPGAPAGVRARVPGRPPRAHPASSSLPGGLGDFPRGRRARRDSFK
jgi:hypothetical protein